MFNSVLAAGLWRLWRETRDPVAVLVGAAVVFKIVVELSTGRVLFTNTAWPGVPSVHAVGFAVGLLLSVVWCLLRRNPGVLLKSKGRRICPSCHCRRIRSTTASGK